MREFETKNNQEKFTCGEFEYQVIRSARKTMTLEVRRDGNVIVRAPLRTGLPRIKRFVNQKQDWVLGCLERTKEYPRMEPRPLSKTLPISIALSTSVFLFLVDNLFVITGLSCPFFVAR